MLVRGTIQTMGMKDPMCADSRCGAWSYLREYYVRLPTSYHNSQPYPLLFEGPGCGGTGQNLYTLSALDDSVIRVGLSPSPEAQKYHATNPGQGCFDDKEGDDSIEWTFYEDLWDALATQLCFDQNRVFAGGNSSGAWLANELGCKYAGDAKRPIRGVLPNTGGLPTDARYVPTCTSNPVAGMWTFQSGDFTDAFNADLVAINRALKVGACQPPGLTYSTAMSQMVLDPFPIGGGQPDTTCMRFRTCPELFPLVFCSLPGNNHATNDAVVNVGWPAFIGLFSKPPLLAP
jgi:hypothetical protein